MFVLFLCCCWTSSVFGLAVLVVAVVWCRGLLLQLLGVRVTWELFRNEREQAQSFVICLWSCQILECRY